MARFVSRIPFLGFALNVAEHVLLAVAHGLNWLTSVPSRRCLSCNLVFAADDPRGPGDHYSSHLMNSFCVDCNVAHFVDPEDRQSDA